MVDGVTEAAETTLFEVRGALRVAGLSFVIRSIICLFLLEEADFIGAVELS
jgi:hypothetical protein